MGPEDNSIHNRKVNDCMTQGRGSGLQRSIEKLLGLPKTNRE